MFWYEWRQGERAWRVSQEQLIASKMHFVYLIRSSVARVSTVWAIKGESHSTEDKFLGGEHECCMVRGGGGRGRWLVVKQGGCIIIHRSIFTEPCTMSSFFDVFGFLAVLRASGDEVEVTTGERDTLTILGKMSCTWPA